MTWGALLIFSGSSRDAVDSRIRSVIKRIEAKEADAAAFARSHLCMYITIGANTPGRTTRRADLENHPWLIALSEHTMGLVRDTPPENNWQDVVAHEIAHAWLDSQGKLVRTEVEMERAADDQIERWGFNRVTGF